LAVSEAMPKKYMKINLSPFFHLYIKSGIIDDEYGEFY